MSDWAVTHQRNDLLTCPFCGSPAIEQAKLADNDTNIHWRINCGNPFCEAECRTNVCATKDHAERIWQSREGK